ncbi:MAG TPA: histidinol-phosphatase [Lachnospiraceae bacterium]|nr:histidinol-phosphatase [Lachnospiraceae bacterium]
MRIELPEDYPYLYETHLHTVQGSACAADRGSAMARACKEAGYTGIIVTDHNWGGNTAVNRNMPWENWVGEFVKGYEDAKRTGDEIGLDVFFGYEAGYRGTEFLIYGVDKEFMLSHEELRTISVEQQYRLIHDAGGMVVHAHPFREEYYIPEIRLYPEYVDAVEGINATHSNSRSKVHNEKIFDHRAVDYARQHRLPMTAGSDIHRTDLFGGGMAFKRRLGSVQDFIEAVLKGEDYLLTNGEEWFTKEGVLLEKNGGTA